MCSTAPLPHRSTDAPRSRLPAFFVLAVLLGFWAVTIQRLGGLWSALPEYSYGWAVPMLCVILFLERWRTRFESLPPTAASRGTEDPRDIPLGRRLVQLRPRTGGRSRTPVQPVPARAPRRILGLSVSAFLVLLSSLVVFSLSRAALEVIPSWRFAAWGLALTTVALTLFGLHCFSVSAFQRFSLSPFAFPRTSHFAFPICFFLLAVPWPDRFEGPFIQTLTELNAAVTVELLSFLKVTAVRMGNIILIEPGMVGVQEACSGIRSFQSTLMVALFLGELFRFNFWRRVVFVAVGAALSFTFNIVRTSFLVWSCNRDGLGAVDKFHDPAGWTILAASVTGLALLGWWLYRQQRGAGFQPAGAARIPAAAVTPPPDLPSPNSDLQPPPPISASQHVSDSAFPTSPSDLPSPNSDLRPPPSISASQHVSISAFPTSPSDLPSPNSDLQPPPPTRTLLTDYRLLITGFLLLAVLLGTELGLRAWFGMHERPTRSAVVDFATRFETGGATLKPLTISREVKGMLAYDSGTGWEWAGGGGERWQAFLFSWEEPNTLARRIISAGAATGHQPEMCFTRAGMQLKRVFGHKRYVANGVPLVFKGYEFADRNIPIFVFSSTWERNKPQATAEEEQLAGNPSTSRGLRQAIRQLKLGERGITDEVRVFKFGVWGPRTIGEAEAAFQQQLNSLVRPAGENKK